MNHEMVPCPSYKFFGTQSRPHAIYSLMNREWAGPPLQRHLLVLQTWMHLHSQMDTFIICESCPKIKSTPKTVEIMASYGPRPLTLWFNGQPSTLTLVAYCVTGYVSWKVSCSLRMLRSLFRLWNYNKLLNLLPKMAKLPSLLIDLQEIVTTSHEHRLTHMKCADPKLPLGPVCWTATPLRF